MKVIDFAIFEQNQRVQNRFLCIFLNADYQ